MISLSLYLDNKSKNTLWRLNSSILNNVGTKQYLISEIEQYMEQNDNNLVSPTILWDAFKAVIGARL